MPPSMMKQMLTSKLRTSAVELNGSSPIEVFASVRPKTGGDGTGKLLTIEGNTIRGPTTTARFSEVLTKPDFDSLYHSAVEPLVKTFRSGRNACLMVFGETGSGKSHTVCGSQGGRGGVIEHIARDLYADLPEDAVITATAWELHNELLGDLRIRENDGVEVMEDDVTGVTLKGISTHRLRDERECIKHFREANANRNQDMTSFGVVSARATIAMTLKLQLPGEGAPTATFFLVNTPGAEALADDPTKSRMTEGPNLNRAIRSLYALANTLSDGVRAVAEARFSDSKLTQLLQDAFGGNCRTAVIVTLPPYETPALEPVLQFSLAAAQIRNFPVVCTPELGGLQRRARYILASHSSMLEGVDRKAFGGGTDSMDGVDLESKVIESGLEAVRLKEENAKLQNKLVQARAEHNDMVEEKMRLQATLISSEEERLKTGKALVDLQIESAKVRADGENRHFEASNKVLLLENDVIEGKMKSEALEKQCEELQGRVRSLEADKRDISEEYAALKHNHLRLTQDLRAETSKNEELGLELLSLVNGRVVLLKEKDAYAMELEKLKAVNTGLKEHVSSAETDEGTHKAELEKLEERIKQLQSEMQARQTELVQQNMQLENQKIELEKELLQAGKQKDAELAEVRERYSAETEALRSQLKSLQDGNLKTSMSTRQYERVAQEAQGELKVLKMQLEAAEAEIERCTAASERFVSEYRGKLNQYIKEIGEFVNAADGQLQAGMEVQLKKYVDLMLKDVAGTYMHREQELAAGLERRMKGHAELQERLEQLQAAYRICRDQLNEAGIAVSDLGKFELAASDSQSETARLRQALAEAQQKLAMSENSVTLPQTASAMTDDALSPLVRNQGPLGEDSWAEIKQVLKDFTLGTQRDLERERAELLVRSAASEERATQLEQFITTNLATYQKEIKRLREALARQTKPIAQVQVPSRPGVLPGVGMRPVSDMNNASGRIELN